MASTQAMLAGMTGINTFARNLDVISNNIANTGTTGFKSSRMLFSNLFSRTMSEGSGPGDTTGGTNPTQFGYGVRVGGTQRNMNNGPISATGDSRDLAIDGGGFFVVSRGADQFYTRAGAFRPNAIGQLTTPNGELLMGYGVDSNFNVVQGVLQPVSVPTGSLTIAQATSEVRMSGNLNAAGTLPTQGSRGTLTGTTTAGLRLIAGANPPASPGDLIETNSRLIDIEDPAAPLSNNPLFVAGQTLEVKGVEKGSKTLESARLDITATTTMQDLMDFLRQATGIDPSVGANPDGRTPGVTLDPVTGTINIVGNTGSVNDLTIDASDLRVLDASGTFVRSPFVSQKQASADGESVRTTYEIYDSLGNPVQVDVTVVLDSKTNSGTNWRYYVESGDSSGIPRELATGTLAFDTSGQLTTTTPITVDVDRSGTGAASPLSFTMSFSGDADNVTALADVRSQIAATYRDGTPLGTLSTFEVGQDGTIFGGFSNGLTRTLGQVVLSTFSNPEGLVDLGSGLYRSGANSGAPQIKAPTSLGAGNLVGGALEGSNVDLSEEFIKMILTSTGYSANSRVIRTADELMQQLLVIGR
jgi:flagellar hook protein FlgE